MEETVYDRAERVLTNPKSSKKARAAARHVLSLRLARELRTWDREKMEVNVDA